MNVGGEISYEPLKLVIYRPPKEGQLLIETCENILTFSFESQKNIKELFPEGLSEVIKRFNEKFDTTFKESDLTNDESEYSRVLLEAGSPKLFSLLKEQTEIKYNFVDNPKNYQNKKLELGGFLFFDGNNIIIVERMLI